MSRHFDLFRDTQPVPTHRDEYPGSPAVPGDRRQTIEIQAEPQPNPAWRRAIDALRHHWKLSVLFTTCVIAASVAMSLIAKSVYEPTAALQIDPPGTEAFSLQGNNNADNSAEYVGTQVKNLQGGPLALAVVRSLRLDRKPDFAGKLAGGSDEAGTSHPDGKTDLPASPAEKVAEAQLRARTQVMRDSSSRLVYVTVGAHDPVLAAQVTNKLTELFIAREYKARHDAVMQSSEWLGRQLDDIRGRMEQSNRTLAEFQKSTGIAPLGGTQGTDTFSDRMVELNRQLMTAQGDRIQLEAYLKRFDGGAASSLPQISGSPVVQQLTEKLAEVRAELTNNLAIYGRNHPLAKKLQNQADELQKQLDAQRSAILADLRTSYSASRKRESMVQAQVQDASKQLMLVGQYAELKKEADANAALYNSLFAKIKEAGIAAESKSSGIRVVEPAPVLDSPTRPHRLRNIAAGVFVGIFGGILLALLLESVNRTVRTALDVRKLFGPVPLSLVPVIGVGERTVPNRSGPFIARKSAKRHNASLFLLDRPQSPEAEALRSLYTSVRLALHGFSREVLLVASAHPGEGKTTMSVNLAVVLAERGRTCIVDADLRREGVAPAFGIHIPIGVGEVLRGVATLEEALAQSGIPNLYVLGTGRVSADEPARLISSDAMGQLIRELRARFDFVLIDSPPVLPYSDSLVLSSLADGVLLIGRSGVTRRDAMMRAMELLQGVRGAPVLQVVLNAAQQEGIDYGYYQDKEPRKTA